MKGALYLQEEGNAVRVLTIVLALALMGTATGCLTSDKIVELEPDPGQPHLNNLESHLDYQDPDAGQDDYIPDR
jgi:hypothetical protein